MPVARAAQHERASARSRRSKRAAARSPRAIAPRSVARARAVDGATRRYRDEVRVIDGSLDQTDAFEDHEVGVSLIWYGVPMGISGPEWIAKIASGELPSS